jgi:hypothetical protein
MSAIITKLFSFSDSKSKDIEINNGIAKVEAILRDIQR